MWLFEWLLSMLSYPIKWFWKGYEKYREENKAFMVVILWIVSFTGVVIIGYAMYRLFDWLFVFHMDIVIVAGLIMWLYAYIKSKLDIGVNEDIPVEMQELIEQANRAYPTVRNILYQTLKTSAESIGGAIPRLLEEIEVAEQHYTISNNICFFQFRLAKADIRIRYEQNELREFERILQNDISRKIKAGEFPTLGIEQLMDSYGNIYDAINIDVIEDVDNCFLIQVVLYSPQYAEYIRQKKMNRQSMLIDNSVPSAKWDK